METYSIEDRKHEAAKRLMAHLHHIHGDNIIEVLLQEDAFVGFQGFVMPENMTIDPFELAGVEGVKTCTADCFVNLTGGPIICPGYEYSCTNDACNSDSCDKNICKNHACNNDACGNKTCSGHGCSSGNKSCGTLQSSIDEEFAISIDELRHQLNEFVRPQEIEIANQIVENFHLK